MNNRLFIGVVVAVLFILNPWVWEGTSNNCGALEMRVMDITAQKNQVSPALRGLVGLSDGRLATLMAAKNVPDWPTPLTCVVGYWRAVLDPK